MHPECSITPGDLIEDEDGRWRGPIPHGHELVGRISSSIFWKPRICKPNTQAHRSAPEADVERGADSGAAPCSASLACIAWGEQILRNNELSEWCIEWTPGNIEGICIFKTRTIIIHWPHGKPDYPLMAHEIAHVITDARCQSRIHDSHFAHEYMKLVRCYFTPNAEVSHGANNG